MLQSDEIEALRFASEQLLSPIVDFLIKDIAKRVAEAGQFTATAQYEIWKTQTFGLSQYEIKKRVAKLLNLSMEEAEHLFRQSAKTGYSFDLNRLPTARAIPFEENTVVQQIVNAAVDMAREDLSNITQTLGFVTQDGVCKDLTQAYTDVCDFAFMQVSTGAADYNTAIREAVRNLKKRGIQYIDYNNNRHTSVEVAVRRNVFSSLGTMQEKISHNAHDISGCDGWEISAHAASAPDHEPIQGKQYRDAEYEALNNSLVRRIGTLNCGHAAFPIVYGVSRPQHTEAELAELRKDNEEGIEYRGQHYTKYEATQRQRALERKIREQKRRILIDETVGDEEQLQTDQIKYQMLNREYRDFSEAAGLRRQYERMEMSGFGPKQARAAEETQNAMEAVRKKAEEEELRRQKNLQIIRDDATIKANSGLPKKLVGLPDEKLQHNVNVNIDPTAPGAFEFHAIAPKGIDLTKIEVMAGAGTSTPIRDLRRLYATYNRDADGWQKKSGTAYGEDFHYVIHWYEHNGFIPENEIKLKGMKKNK